MTRGFEVTLIAWCLSAQGCYSYVKTYDGKGAKIAECNYGAMWFGLIPVWNWMPVAPCHGSADPRAQTDNKVLNIAEPWAGDKQKTASCPEGSSWNGAECYPNKRTLFKDVMDKRTP